MLRYLIMVTLLLGACVYAWRRGGRPEKGVAAILLGMLASDRLYHMLPGDQGIYDGIDYGHLLIDGSALIAFAAIALKADRFWTLFIGALQIIATMAHVLRGIETEMHPVAYAIIIRVPGWAQIALLYYGIWSFDRRSRAQEQHF